MICQLAELRFVINPLNFLASIISDLICFGKTEVNVRRGNCCSNVHLSVYTLLAREIGDESRPGQLSSRFQPLY